MTEKDHQQTEIRIPTLIKCLLLVLGCGFCWTTNTYAQVQPTDIKVLEEHKDANGNKVRTIQYYQNGSRIVETRTVVPKANLNAPIDPDTLNKEFVMVVINKTRLVLDVYYRRSRIRSYRVVFGPKPLENKKMKGDRCTPEGRFTIAEKHPSTRYNKFIQIDYPNDSSRRRFELLKQKGVIPPNAEIGGDVGIHGIWKGGDEMIELGVGWTDGCIAMKNADVDEFYKLVGKGVNVYIRR